MRSPSLSWKWSRSFDAFGWLLLPGKSRRSLSGSVLGSWVNLVPQSGCSVLGPVLLSPCSALPPPLARTTGAAGAPQGIGPQGPVQLQGLSPETSDAGCLHRNVFFLCSISSSLSSDKYPLSPPRPASVAFQVFLLPAAITMDKYMGYFLSQKVRSLLIVQFSYPSAFIFIVSRWAATL